MTTSEELKQKRRANIKIALKASNTTNILKGLNRYVSFKTKQAEQKNKLINQLLLNGMYQNIYNKYCDYLEQNPIDNLDELLKYIKYQEYQILNIFDYCKPEELEALKSGFVIQEIPLNL